MTLKGYERKAALDVLDQISEFRFVYWTDHKSRSYTVKRDWDDRSDLWGIFEGDGAWTGEEWTANAGFPDSFRWTLDDALKIAQRLAYEENQRIVAIMERDYPGEYKGSGHDFAATRTGALSSMADIQRSQLKKLGQKITENDGRAPGRHLEINPEPLKVVEAKAGDAGPEPEYVFARRWRGEYLKAASIHRDWCPAVPEDGKALADGSHWSVEKIPRHKINECFAWAADKGVEARVDCSRCRGWSVT